MEIIAKPCYTPTLAPLCASLIEESFLPKERNIEEWNQ